MYLLIVCLHHRGPGRCEEEQMETNGYDTGKLPELLQRNMPRPRSQSAKLRAAQQRKYYE